ncbi:MAG: hypothetical protein SGPRY_010251 [Prymnesium sp.]
MYDFVVIVKVHNAARALGLSDATRVVKSLVFVSSLGEPLLLLARGSDRISLPSLERKLGCTLRIATPEEARELTGHDVGSIPPLSPSFCEAMRVLMDERVLRSKGPVFAGAGAPGLHMRISPAELKRASSAESMTHPPLLRQNRSRRNPAEALAADALGLSDGCEALWVGRGEVLSVRRMAANLSFATIRLLEPPAELCGPDAAPRGVLPVQGTTDPERLSSGPTEVISDPTVPSDLSCDPNELSCDPVEESSHPARLASYPKEIIPGPTKRGLDPAERNSEPRELSSDSRELIVYYASSREWQMGATLFGDASKLEWQLIAGETLIRELGEEGRYAMRKLRPGVVISAVAVPKLNPRELADVVVGGKRPTKIDLTLTSLQILGRVGGGERRGSGGAGVNEQRVQSSGEGEGACERKEATVDDELEEAGLMGLPTPLFIDDERALIDLSLTIDRCSDPSIASLLQLSHDQRVYVVDLQTLKQHESASRLAGDLISRLLSSPRLRVVGFAVEEDLRRLDATFPGCTEGIGGRVIDLQPAARAVLGLPRRRPPSLKTAVAALL